MGLDMYLQGRKFYMSERKVEDGFQISEVVLDLGYWRKHPDLHGYIVETFAEGKDECQDIDLSLENMQSIVEAVKKKGLPKTRGFFFGESDDPNDQNTIKQLNAAIKWRETKEDGVIRSVVYRASW